MPRLISILDSWHVREMTHEAHEADPGTPHLSLMLRSKIPLTRLLTLPPVNLISAKILLRHKVSIAEIAMNLSTPQSNSEARAEQFPAAPLRTSARDPSFSNASLSGRMLSYGSDMEIEQNQVQVNDREIHNTCAFSGLHDPPAASAYAPQIRSMEFDIIDPGTSPCNPPELPLKRPADSDDVPPTTEMPLRRPMDENEEIAFSDIIATFAVDVSGSTQGPVLEEEKDAIKSISSGLSRDAQTQAQIIPWCDYPQHGVRLCDIGNLRSGGGTYPNTLNTGLEAKTALSKCSAWFLLTDGEIAPQSISQFSQGVCEASLHGTPCVIILFGYKSNRPLSCNVSVGLSVFSNATDCLFLFHDVDTTQVYIFQSKGKFNSVLPLGCATSYLTPKRYGRIFRLLHTVNCLICRFHYVSSYDLTTFYSRGGKQSTCKIYINSASILPWPMKYWETMTT